MADYYARRAAEYERVYQKPERQKDLTAIRRGLPELFIARRVIEVACGTGFWTEAIATTALSVLATDVNQAMLDIARTKQFPAGCVSFQIADAFNFDGIAARFDAAFTGFWWSHIPKSGQSDFLQVLHKRLLTGSIVVLLDNRYVAGSSTPISRTDAHGNTYQRRGLSDGTEQEVLKNFPTRDELEGVLGMHADQVSITEFDYYWLATYRT